MRRIYKMNFYKPFCCDYGHEQHKKQKRLNHVQIEKLETQRKYNLLKQKSNLLGKKVKIELRMNKLFYRSATTALMKLPLKKQHNQIKSLRHID